MAKVYVSSTIVDLDSERRAVMEWLRAAKHQAVDSYLPNSETVRDSCLDDVDTCDLYVLILGHRYGFQPVDRNPENLSITHLEYRRAGESGIPRVALLRTSIPDVSKSDVDNPQRAPLVLAFRSEVQREVRPAEFSDPRELIQGLSTGVQSELDKLRGPSTRRRAETWLAAHLQNVVKQFASHMAALQLKPGARPEELYLDLVVAERHLGKREEAKSEQDKLGKEVHPLLDLMQQVQAPLLLIGEGGSGKTTSLLHAAARTAERAQADKTAAIPIYVNLARLTKMEDIPTCISLSLTRCLASVTGRMDLGRRAGKVLSAIPGGTDPIYQLIQEELERGGLDRALEMIEASLEIMPDDANLFWWRGHALRSLGRLEMAADSFQRASELEKEASVIPQALAQIFLELGDFPRAMETARRGVEIDPANAEAQVVLAWSSYKAGEISVAVEAAARAVDLDPVHSDAIWIVVLGHIRQASVKESRLAFEHALRARQLLSPGLSNSFVTSFAEELERINTDNGEISRLIGAIKSAILSEDKGGSN
jgi:tetratricopeptide (TPR) repeat protein